MPKKSKSPECVLVLQGGGALGAYQGGVFDQLAQADVAIDWVVGTSIGAINGAIIAGNPPEHRLAKLRGFWHSLAPKPTPMAAAFGGEAMPWLQPWLQAWQDGSRTLGTLMQGVPGFFTPRLGVDMQRELPTGEASFYDTSSLRQTLCEHVDFAYLNAGHVRYTAQAVNVATAELVNFDNHRGTTLRPEHVMASGALPPGFAAVDIDGAFFWDGGIYSNTPLDVVLDDAPAKAVDRLVLMVDLWDPTQALPRSLAQVCARQKDIQYASRSTQHLDEYRKRQSLRSTIAQLGHAMPKPHSPQVLALLSQAQAPNVTIVRLVMKALPRDDAMKDIDFSAATVLARWAAGVLDAKRALAHAHWFEPSAPQTGLVVHELAQLPA